MYKIIYGELIDSKGMLRRRPGKQPYICFDKSLKGSPERALNVLIPLMDADQALTKRQKCQEQTIYLEDVETDRLDLDQPVVAAGQRETDFCRN